MAQYILVLTVLLLLVIGVSNLVVKKFKSKRRASRSKISNSTSSSEGKRTLTCRACGSTQAVGAWEAALTQKGIRSIGARPECLECGSTRLVDLSDPRSVERDASTDIPERGELVALCERYVGEVQRYRSGVPSKETEMDAIRKQMANVGERIGGKGGLMLMRQIGYSLDKPEWRSVVDSSWNGIHGWMS